jgi:hypothetical protein
MAKGKGNGAGRPTVMTPEVIRKLEEAFANDATDLEACFYAGISHAPFYKYQEEHPEFKERKEALKSHLGLIAKNTVARSIKSGNELDAKWYLERRRKNEYSTRNENTGADGKDLSINWPLPRTELDEVHTPTSIPAVPHEEPEVVLPSLPPSRR